MVFFKWNSEFESGNDIMDNDHKVLVQLINDLYVEMARGDGSVVVESVIEKLVDNSKNHFRREEKLMKSLSYPDFEKHELEHDAFIAKVSQCSRNIKSDSVTTNLARFLKDWLVNHILSSDKRFASFMELKMIAG
ncbi:MAG: bacteriohemerythrin [Tenuifilaceae bacterium]|nr:bacteriohemerythrin [Tenuifilaceae bacterium]